MILNTQPGTAGLSVDSIDWNLREMNLGQLGYLAQNFIDQRIQPNHQRGGAFCAVSGIWYPTADLRKDGYGRIVGKDYWVPGRPPSLY